MAKCKLFSLSVLLLTIHQVRGICIPDIKGATKNNSNEIEAFKRISLLVGQKWEIEGYGLGICVDELDKHKNAGAVWHKNPDLVLGYVNRTHAISGDNWVLLQYRGGQADNSSTCVGNYSTEIYIICDPHEVHQTPPRFLEISGCVARFQLLCPLVCHEESPSVTPILFGWLFFLFSLYCLVGILYRRFAVRARGCQQLPHLPFWSKVGSACADGCNWACRCEEEAMTTWDADTDRDDVLLRP